MIKVGIIGATGYAGGELVRILMGHKDAEVVWYGSRSYVDQKYADVYRNMFQIVDAKCMDDNMDELAEQVDVIFTATPQGLCASLINEEILSKTKIIDLSADFRLKDVKVYEEWYKIEHKAPQYIDEAVYGLCEINRDKVKDARIVANPGCYTTCSILTAYPLAKEGLIDMSTLIIDAKSGTSGAGRGAKLPNLYCEVNENIKAYGVATHRHTPEIEEQLGYAAGEKVAPSDTISVDNAQRAGGQWITSLFENVANVKTIKIYVEEGKGNFAEIEPVTGPKEDQKWIGIAPFAKHAGKIYPLELQEQVIAHFAANPKVKVFLFGGGKSEQDVFDAWIAKYPSVVSMIGKLNMRTELNLMSHLDVMLSMDSANMHLASLVNIPVSYTHLTLPTN